MSFINNQSRTLDGINTISGDIINVVENLEVDGFDGYAGYFLKKNKITNKLEWGTIALSDEAIAGNLIDFNGNTIDVDLSESLDKLSTITMGDYIVVSISNDSSNGKVKIQGLFNKVFTITPSITYPNLHTSDRLLLYDVDNITTKHTTISDLTQKVISTFSLTNVSTHNNMLLDDEIMYQSSVNNNSKITLLNLLESFFNNITSHNHILLNDQIIYKKNSNGNLYKGGIEYIFHNAIDIKNDFNVLTDSTNSSFLINSLKIEMNKFDNNHIDRPFFRFTNSSNVLNGFNSTGVECYRNDFNNNTYTYFNTNQGGGAKVFEINTQNETFNLYSNESFINPIFKLDHSGNSGSSLLIQDSNANEMVRFHTNPNDRYVEFKNANDTGYHKQFTINQNNGLSSFEANNGRALFNVSEFGVCTFHESISANNYHILQIRGKGNFVPFGPDQCYALFSNSGSLPLFKIDSLNSQCFFYDTTGVHRTLLIDNATNKTFFNSHLENPLIEINQNNNISNIRFLENHTGNHYPMLKIDNVLQNTTFFNSDGTKDFVKISSDKFEIHNTSQDVKILEYDDTNDMTNFNDSNDNQSMLQIDHTNRDNIFLHIDPNTGTLLQSVLINETFINICGKDGNPILQIDLTINTGHIGSIKFLNVPNNPANGSAGDLYVDSNGFMKII